jgi:hypothetical protein
VLAASAVDFLLGDDLRKQARDDFDKRRSETKYEPVLDPGPPPERLDDF